MPFQLLDIAISIDLNPSQTLFPQLSRGPVRRVSGVGQLTRQMARALLVMGGAEGEARLSASIPVQFLFSVTSKRETTENLTEH